MLLLLPLALLFKPLLLLFDPLLFLELELYLPLCLQEPDSLCLRGGSLFLILLFRDQAVDLDRRAHRQRDLEMADVLAFLWRVDW